MRAAIVEALRAAMSALPSTVSVLPRTWAWASMSNRLVAIKALAAMEEASNPLAPAVTVPLRLAPMRADSNARTCKSPAAATTAPSISAATAPRTSLRTRIPPTATPEPATAALRLTSARIWALSLALTVTEPPATIEPLPEARSM